MINYNYKYELGDIVKWKDYYNDVCGVGKIVALDAGEYLVVVNNFIKCNSSFKYMKDKFFDSNELSKKWDLSTNPRQNVYWVSPTDIIKINSNSNPEDWSVFWATTNSTINDALIILIEERNWNKACEMFFKINKITPNNSSFGGVSYALCPQPPWLFFQKTYVSSQYIFQGLNLPKEFNLQKIAQHSAVKLFFKEEFDE